MSTYALFRAFAVPRSPTQKDLLHKEEAKEKFISRVFSENCGFNYRGTKIEYLFKHSEKGAIFGQLGKVSIDSTHLPPEEGFQEFSFERWEVANTIINLQPGNDVQVLAIGFDPKMKVSNSLVKTWSEKINDQNSFSIWKIEINPVIEEQNFWSAYEENREKVTEVVFEFVVPNPIGFREEVANGLREYRDMEGAQEVDLKIKSSPGRLNLYTDRVKGWVGYVLDGAGRLVLRTGKKPLFDSSLQVTKQLETQELNDVESAVGRRAILQSLFPGNLE